MILTIRPAQRADALSVGARLRREDADEVVAALSMSPADGTLDSFTRSTECYALRLERGGRWIDPEPALLFGVTDEGSVWLLATNAIKRAPLSILREAPFWLDHWNVKYGDLYNYVDTRNTLHLRWLQAMGFHLGVTVEHNGHTFQYALRSCVQQHP